MTDSGRCRETTAQLTEYLEGAATWNQRIRSLLHLKLCRGCNRLKIDIERLPQIIDRFARLDPAISASIGEAALTYALAHLHEARPSRKPAGEVPPAVQHRLLTTTDVPFRLMARVHAAIVAGTAPKAEPFLPADILAELPPSTEWSWHGRRGLRRAQLWRQEEDVTLSLVFMPPHFTLASHRHEGSESLLVLEGELEHEDRCLTDGDWIHLEAGSSHRPHAFGTGCWCLVRDEGGIHYLGPLGWFRNRRAPRTDWPGGAPGTRSRDPRPGS